MDSLNKDNLLELGFNYTEDATIKLLGVVLDWYEKEETPVSKFKIRLFENNRIEITRVYKDNSVVGFTIETLFKGVIKNKSELKVLLKQLEINK